jgi:hypothetical protein
MKTHLTNPPRIVVLQPDENGNDTTSFDRAFYEASEQPSNSLQEFLEKIAEKMREQEKMKEREE